MARDPEELKRGPGAGDRGLSRGAEIRIHARLAVLGCAVLRRAVLTRAALIGLLVFSLPALHGQYTRNSLRTVTGAVTDGGHEPLRGAVVQIEAADTLVIESYLTNERGEYHFRNLRGDADYTLWASFRGNRSKTHAMGKFDHKLDREIPITVELVK